MKIQPLLLASAVLLMGCGIVALFAPQETARLLGVSGERAPGLVQLLAGALFGLGMLDWMNRYATIGGIYGRPLVVANFAFFFIATTTLARHAAVEGSPAMWGAEFLCLVFAVAYGWLLFRGPRSSSQS